MAPKVFVNTYHVHDTELASFLGIARSALAQIPPVPGFSFGIFHDPEERPHFAELFVMPDPEETGIDGSLEVYHFSSSFQPERSTCTEPGTRTVTFRGSLVAGEPPEGDLAGGVIRFAPLWAEPDDQERLLAALQTVAARASGRTTLLGLKSAEYPKVFGLLEGFDSLDAARAAPRADLDAGDGDLAAALAFIKSHIRAAHDLPATFVHLR